MTDAELLAVLAILDAHLPRNHPLIAVVEREWQQTRNREPHSAEEAA